MQSPSLKHIAIICDGNRRWAKNKGLKPIDGHTYAFDKTITSLVDKAIELKIPYLTFWIFSTENWNRPKIEVSGLMKLFRTVFSTKASSFHKQNVKINHIGDISKFDRFIQANIKKWVKKTNDNKTLTLTFAANYGGRDEIIRAIKKIPEDKIKKITEKDFVKYLDTNNIPDPDMIVRTGGDIRLSGFLLWQCQYSEFYFTKTYFPNFDGKKLEEAVREFGERQRRFGK